MRILCIKDLREKVMGNLLIVPIVFPLRNMECNASRVEKQRRTSFLVTIWEMLRIWKHCQEMRTDAQSFIVSLIARESFDMPEETACFLFDLV